MAPVPFIWSEFMFCTVGTGLAVASANTFNQVIEIEKDKLMLRTLKRILPTGKVSVGHAIAFGLVTGTLGVALLTWKVNNVSALLALINIILYTLVYTPMKQVHPINTWVGAFVGAIPPMIGWSAATGGLEAGAWALAALLYVWQIPHFLSLSWFIRQDYKNAGYKMLSVVNPERVPVETYRWSIATLPLGACCWAAGLTHPAFIFDSVIPNLYLIRSSRKFLAEPTNANAKHTFFATLWYLPAFLLLMMLHKMDNQSDNENQNQQKENEDKS